MFTRINTALLTYPSCLYKSTAQLVIKVNSSALVSSIWGIYSWSLCPSLPIPIINFLSISILILPSVSLWEYYLSCLTFGICWNTKKNVILKFKRITLDWVGLMIYRVFTTPPNSDNWCDRHPSRRVRTLVHEDPMYDTHKGIDPLKSGQISTFFVE